MPLAEVVDEEERLKNTPAEGIYRDKKRVEENVESDRGTEQDIYDAIDEKLIKKAKILTPKSKYQGTVKEIDQRGNARLTFFNEKTYGTLRAREVKAYEKAHKRAMKE
ncbi:hypothetical protein KKG31_04440 [Patescibacteria group bacterium]|nr:hypothetical protein [Patescibacteria group bacterium]MBU1758389.1 hypothetical protein [Patescibacteria group bacterium]